MTQREIIVNAINTYVGPHVGNSTEDRARERLNLFHFIHALLDAGWTIELTPPGETTPCRLGLNE
jgi:hypothetical protein